MNWKEKGVLIRSKLVIKIIHKTKDKYTNGDIKSLQVVEIDLVSTDRN